MEAKLTELLDGHMIRLAALMREEEYESASYVAESISYLAVTINTVVATDILRMSGQEEEGWKG